MKRSAVCVSAVHLLDPVLPARNVIDNFSIFLAWGSAGEAGPSTSFSLVTSLSMTILWWILATKSLTRTGHPAWTTMICNPNIDGACK